MKILLLSHKFYPFIGGIEVNSEMLANEFHQAGHSVHIVTTTTAQGDKQFPYTIIRNPDKKILLKEHFWADVILENNSCFGLSWPAYIFRLPVVVAVNTWVERPDGRISFIDRVKMQVLRKAKKVIAVSEAIKDKTYKKSIVIHNAYRTEQFKIDPKVERNKDFVFLGRLVSTKGGELAVRAIKQLKEDSSINKDIKFTIIGTGPEQTNLESLVAESGLKENVFFTGALSGEKLRNALNEHRIMLVPSLWEEPFGNVALEGMACGCVPIVSNGGGLPDAVGKAGLIFERGDVNSMVSCMKQLLTNTSLFTKLRSEASEHLKNHHPAIMAQQYLDVLKTVAKQ